MDAAELYRAEKAKRARPFALDHSKAERVEQELRKKADKLFGEPRKPGRAVDPAQTQRWIELYQQGHSLRQIGRLENANWGTIHKRLLKNGVQLREAPIRKGMSVRALEKLEAQGQILEQILQRLTALEQQGMRFPFISTTGDTRPPHQSDAGA